MGPRSATGMEDEVKANRESNWLRRFPSQGAALRLFCLPYAGGSARIYSDWHDWLAPEIEVVALELPGRGVNLRAAPIASMDELLTRLLAEMGPLLERPYALFGHSLGGLVAFELARALDAGGGRAPAHLFVSALRAPHLPSTRPALHALGDDELIAALRVTPGSPAALLDDDELLRLLLPVLRADFRLAETPAPAPVPPLSMPLTVFGGLADATLERGDLEAWRPYTSASCQVRLVPGDHFFIHDFGHLVAVSLQDVLRAGRPAAAPPSSAPVEMLLASGSAAS